MSSALPKAILAAALWGAAHDMRPPCRVRLVNGWMVRRERA